MATVVLVHGIAQQHKGPATLLNTWLPALRDGVTLASSESSDSPVPNSGADVTAVPEDTAMAFYGDVFRPPGTRLVGPPPYTPADLTHDLDRDLLLTWWAAAAEVDPTVPAPDDRTRGRTPHVIQRALYALSRCRFFAGLGDRALIGALLQVRRYLTEDAVREAAQRRVLAQLTPATRLVVAHSLGSVVAYEALHRHPGNSRLALITVGSPLGIPNLIFHRLQPHPVDGLGGVPAAVRTWTNLADRGDVVALVKTLAPLFDGAVTDIPVHNGSAAHDVRPYLTARQTGRAVVTALSAPDA